MLKIADNIDTSEFIETKLSWIPMFEYKDSLTPTASVMKKNSIQPKITCRRFKFISFWGEGETSNSEIVERLARDELHDHRKLCTRHQQLAPLKMLKGKSLHTHNSRFTSNSQGKKLFGGISTRSWREEGNIRTNDLWTRRAWSLLFCLLFRNNTTPIKLTRGRTLSATIGTCAISFVKIILE